MKLIILCLVLQMLPAAVPTRHDDVTVETLNNFILPIELGQSRLVYAKHTFLHYLDISSIITQIDNLMHNFLVIKNNINVMNSSNPISYHGLAENMLVRTEFLIETTRKKLENLYPTFNVHERSKRGLINVIGKINKWLFGNLDADDEQRYNNAILTLEQNQKDMLTEVNLQISLSKKLINHYDKTIHVLNENQEKLEKDLIKFQAAIQSNIENINDYISFQGTISQINLDCQNVITFIDNIENAIVFSKLNTLHSSIISSYEIKEMIEYLKKIYSQYEIPNFKNILTYYQFLGTQVTFSNSKLIFAIHVPILRTEVLKFFHLYPLIQKHQIFTPKYPYLARKKPKIQFEKEECPQLEEIYYCNERFNPADECTLEFIDGNTPQDCQTLQINVQDPIIEQVTQDAVLLIPSKPIRIFSSCNTDQFLDIEVPVLIKIPYSCEVRINEEKFMNNIEAQHGKPLILPKLNITRLEKAKFFEVTNFTKLNLEEMFQISEMAKQLKPIRFHEITDKKSIIFTIILIIIIIVILSYLGWRSRGEYSSKWRICQKKKRSPGEVPENSEPKMNSIIFSS